MKDERVYLRHISDAIAKVESYVAVGHETFMAESHWQDAVIRQLEIIGEATRKLSRGFRSQHPQVPWRRIAGLRDVLIHDYMGVRLPAVWEVTQRDIPVLKAQIERILEEGTPDRDNP